MCSPVHLYYTIHGPVCPLLDLRDLRFSVEMRWTTKFWGGVCIGLFVQIHVDTHAPPDGRTEPVATASARRSGDDVRPSEFDWPDEVPPVSLSSPVCQS